MVASRLVPGAIVWVMLIVFCSELSNRFVLSSGVSIIVPRKIAAAATSVIDLVVDGPPERRQVGVLQAGQLLLVAVADLALGEQPGGGDRDDDQGHGQAAEQREGHGEGERPEELGGEPVDEAQRAGRRRRWSACSP